MGIIPIPISGTGRSIIRYRSVNYPVPVGQSSGTGRSIIRYRSVNHPVPVVIIQPVNHPVPVGQLSGTGCHHTAGQSSGTGRSIIRYRLSSYSRLSRYCGIKYTVGLNATCHTQGGSSV
jgi:hypothetical protein